MNSKELYSIRMRASLSGEHISGAERIAEKDHLRRVLLELSKRPSCFDKMVLTVEKLSSVEIIERALKISSYDFNSVKEARDFAKSLLIKSGVNQRCANLAIELLSKGPSPDFKNMRGAILMNPESCERLEKDPYRGVRTIKVDWLSRSEIKKILINRSIRKEYLSRLPDALALATKNVFCGVLAELCWSDDLNYQTGYVASPSLGYVRIKPLKEKDSPRGGRVYFVPEDSLENILNCLENTPLLIRSL
ncbi:MAG: 6-carboxyhexanoate--CoA ligase [Aquificaceae bacterium]